MRQVAATIERMPVPTWRRLHVNEAEVVLRQPDRLSGDGGTAIRASGQIEIKNDVGSPDFGRELEKLFTSAEIQNFIDESANLRHFIRIPRNHAEKEPIVLSLWLGAESPVLTDDLVIEAEEGSRAVVILEYTSESGLPVQHCGRTRVFLRPNADLKLVKVQMLNEKAAHTDFIGGVAEKGARLEVILAELGAARPLSDCNLILKGEGAATELDVVYLGDGQRSLDLSCRVEHRGRKTVSKICGKGILLEKSRKVFRDTLDFIRGSSGSKGREEESVLMLDPRVKNVSAPLLLCGEDDVEGEHATSSGRPDDKILFYLMSRGIGELEARKLLAQAAVSSVIEKIPEERIREKILGSLRESIERGGKQDE